MPVELKGQQLRISVANKNLFRNFRTHDVGRKGRLQRIAGIVKSTGEWNTQSWRLNLSTYDKLQEVLEEITNLKLPKSKEVMAKVLARKWWTLHRK